MLCTTADLLIHDGRVVACGDYQSFATRIPDATTTTCAAAIFCPASSTRTSIFPQLRVLGGLGRSLLDWLEQCALPEEARMVDHSYACRVARGFVHALVSHGTTTALVFGAHFAPATAALFEAAEAPGLRIAAGLVLSDRLLRPELHQTPERAYRESSVLIERFHGRGRLAYAVTPRFALSTSEAMLEVCQTLLREHDGLLFQTHLNENVEEIAEVVEPVSLGCRLSGRVRALRPQPSKLGDGAQRSSHRIPNSIAWPPAAPRSRIARAATRRSAAACFR